MSDKPIILLFIKAPVKGQVKSRLAASVGDDAALELYRCFIRDIIDTLEKTGWPFMICFDPPDAREAVSAWLGERHRYLAQEGAELGAKMENAFKRVFHEGNTRAVLIGSDIPDLTPAVLRDALESLDRNDAVIGPAEDGGYYLIGFNANTFFPRIFHNMVWSTKQVFQETLDILYAASRRVHCAPRWRDVDTMDDLKALSERSGQTAFDTSRTMALLRSGRFPCV